MTILPRCTSWLRSVAAEVALRLWRTDWTFHQYPYGPPDRGLRYGLAWRLYHWGISSPDGLRIDRRRE